MTAVVYHKMACLHVAKYIFWLYLSLIWGMEVPRTYSCTHVISIHALVVYRGDYNSQPSANIRKKLVIANQSRECLAI